MNMIRLILFVLLYFPFCFSMEKDFTIELKDQQLVVKKNLDEKTLDLVDIATVNKSIILDIRYATENNVFKKALYSSAKCYFRRHVAKALDEAQKELEKMGLGLKIFDGFRPWQVQVEGYKNFPDLFAKPTAERAKHPRGTAVDLTLVDKNGNEVLMPTGFDDSTPKASRTCKDVDPLARENREVLEEVMVKYGFVPLPNEWWHFDHYTWKACEIMKLDFDEIEKILKK